MKALVLDGSREADPLTPIAILGINAHQHFDAEILAGVTDPDSARRSAERLLDRAGVPA